MSSGVSYRVYRQTQITSQTQITDEHILNKIAGFVAERGLKHLAPLIRSGPQLKNAALSMESLSKANVNEMRDFPSWSKPTSKLNKLSCRLVRAKNPTALYVYGIRLAFNIGELDAGLSVMKGLQKGDKYARLMFILLNHCAGLDARTEIRLLRSQIQWEEIEKMGHIIMRHISSVGPRRVDTYKDSWYYEDFPNCHTYHEYLENMKGKRCDDCVLWDLSIAVREMS